MLKLKIIYFPSSLNFWQQLRIKSGVFPDTWHDVDVILIVLWYDGISGIRYFRREMWTNHLKRLAFYKLFDHFQ